MNYPPELSPYERIQVERLLFIKSNLEIHLKSYKRQLALDRRLPKDQRSGISKADIQRVQAAIQGVNNDIIEHTKSLRPQPEVPPAGNKPLPPQPQPPSRN